MLALSAVATPVLAVSVASEDVPSDAEVGSEYSATVELEDLFSENDQWQLNATTELENQPLWTIELVDDGDVADTITRTGQNVTFSDTTISSPVDHVRVTVEGEVPAIGNYSYADQSTFSAMSLAQVPVTSDGSTGAPSTIDSWTATHFTTESAALGDAKRFYRNADFEAAVTNAEEAQQLAEDAESQQESSEQTQQLLLYAGVGVVVLLLIGGGAYWYKQNQQDTSRLG